MSRIIQFKVLLRRSRPHIWRRLLVPRNFTFFQLHHVIQIAMGWENFELFEFEIEGYHIGFFDAAGEGLSLDSDHILNCEEVKLSDILSNPGDKLEYVYDFKDQWQHSVRVEKFLKADKSLRYPVCVGGKMNGPRKECGGIHKFNEYLELLKDKKHEEHEDVAGSFGKDYDPLFFDSSGINQQLAQLKEYIRKWNNGGK